MTRKHTVDRHVRLHHHLMQTQAWRSLDAVARAVYIELAALYCGNNNGRIGFSARQAARAIRVSKDSAARAMVRLQERGFIVAITKGRFDRQHHATRWRLTEFKCDLTGQAATKDFEAWSIAVVVPLHPHRRGTDG
jgi:ribosomal protein S5